MIISPNEMNKYISTIIIAPMTTKIRNYPSRIDCIFKGTTGQIVLDQIRTIDKSRLVKHIGIIDENSQNKVLRLLQEMFSK